MSNLLPDNRFNLQQPLINFPADVGTTGQAHDTFPEPGQARFDWMRSAIIALLSNQSSFNDPIEFRVGSVWFDLNTRALKYRTPGTGPSFTTAGESWISLSNGIELASGLTLQQWFDRGGVGPVGPQGPQGPQGTAGISTDTVVNANGLGNYLTMQAAINAGHRNIFVSSDLNVSVATTLPSNSDCRITFAAGTTVTPIGGIPIFKVSNGLTEVRYYHVQYVTVEGDGTTSGQNLLEVADQGGYVNFTFLSPYVEGIDTLVNFTGYDTTFTRPHRIFFHGGACVPRGNNSKLCTTPNPGGTFAGAVSLTFDRTYLASDDIDYRSQLWLANFEGDLKCTDTVIGIKEGSVFGGCFFVGGVVTIGNGDVESDGTYFATNETFSSVIVAGAGTNSRFLTFSAGLNFTPTYMYDCALQFNSGVPPGQTVCFVKPMNFLCDRFDLTHPGIEVLGNGGSVSGVSFSGAHYTNSCIKINNGAYNKISGCHFPPGILGKTIIETGTSNFNIVHDNTGVNNGTGMTLIGGGTVQHDNIA